MELETFFTVPEQSRLLLCAVLLGVPLGLCFDVLRTLRLLLPHGRLAVFLEDVGFLLLWGMALLCFGTVLARGEVRFFFVMGSALGFLTYHCTLGACMVPVLGRCLRGIGRVLRRVLLPLLHIVVRISRCIGAKFSHFAKLCKMRILFWPSPLNIRRKMLYNKEEKCKQEGASKWRRRNNRAKSPGGSIDSSAGRP